MTATIRGAAALRHASIPLAALLLLHPFPACEAQTPPQFEVASVKARKGGGAVTRQVGPATITYLNVSLRELIELAYGVRDYQFSGPAWLDFGSQDRYDFVAKAASPASERELWRMAISLLEERFKLAVHRETRDLPVFALVVAKGGPKIAAGDGSEQSVQMTAGAYSNYTMDAFADLLSTFLQSSGKPVLNRTGLEGRYSFTANLFDIPAGLSAADYRKALVEAVAASQVDSPVFTNLERLGLRLESQKAPLEMLVIDRAEKVPGEN